VTLDLSVAHRTKPGDGPVPKLGKVHALHVNETLLATCTHSVPIEAKTSLVVAKDIGLSTQRKVFSFCFFILLWCMPPKHYVALGNCV